MGVGVAICRRYVHETHTFNATMYLCSFSRARYTLPVAVHVTTTHFKLRRPAMAGGIRPSTSRGSSDTYRTDPCPTADQCRSRQASTAASVSRQMNRSLCRYSIDASRQCGQRGSYPHRRQCPLPHDTTSVPQMGRPPLPSWLSWPLLRAHWPSPVVQASRFCCATAGEGANPRERRLLQPRSRH